MRAYADELSEQGVTVRYITHKKLADVGGLAGLLDRRGLREICVVDPCDAFLERKLDEAAEANGLQRRTLASPQFLTDVRQLEKSLGGREHLSMASFYTAQRKRLDILVEEDKPVGDKWSLDAENRQRLPKDIEIPGLPRVPGDKYVTAAKRYIGQHFPDNPGSTDEFPYPVTRRGAQMWLRDFLKSRLAQFGPYEDAIAADESFLFHSVLSPLLNTGLLMPAQVIERTLRYAEGRDVPLNSLEGFIRQVIGWREFMRGVYLLIGHQQREANFFDCENALPAAFYRARTGIHPVDVVIGRVQEHAYAHHIERLMILGNFFLLCEIYPDHVYRWFMELFIDAYDWVMVPNVYGMSQYADGGRITTKPYISSSNYVRKMSDFAPGSWCDVWDALFWRFVNKHKKVFASNPRMKVMALQLDRMGRDKLKSHLNLAQLYLDTLFR
jgi:deoxyribodipyrimidine photolyase-related protein